jgi:hypothetical protein
MKKILLIAAVAGFVMASCKKDRTCTCTSSSTVPSSNTTTTKTTLVKVTKSSAKAYCVKTSYDQTVGSNTYTYTDDCKLN